MHIKPDMYAQKHTRIHEGIMYYKRIYWREHIEGETIEKFAYMLKVCRRVRHADICFGTFEVLITKEKLF